MAREKKRVKHEIDRFNAEQRTHSNFESFALAKVWLFQQPLKNLLFAQTRALALQLLFCLN